MCEIFKKRFFTQFTTIQLYLIAGNFALAFFLILLSNLGILPLKNISDFLFFSFLFLFFALYRPGWAFLFFVGTIALENINLAPESLGIAVRPYQLSGGLIILAVLIRLIAQRLNFKLEKLRWFDISLFILAAAGFLSSLNSTDKALSFKLSLILSTFVTLYLLARNYVRDLEDLKKIISFLLSSSAVLVFYGIWQNIRFTRGLIAFEVMPGRPNSTFAEADWYGIFLVMLVAAIYGIAYYRSCHSKRSPASGGINSVESKNLIRSLDKHGMIFMYVFATLIYISLILTVSRSAWLGALAATLIFLFLTLTNLKINPKDWQWKKLFWNSFGVLISGIVAVAIVYFFNLTSFQLFNRAESTGTGLQKITISCVPGSEAPEKVGTVEDLEKFGCRHINLEDIEKEIGQNNIVKEIYRNDPNVNVRKEIYKKSWAQIKNHPLLGIGWGNIGKVLGADERGASLNASNIFLEVWLGAGSLGLVAFLIVWIYILIRAVLNYTKGSNFEEKAFAVFIISAWLGMMVSNLFNSGIMLGFLWLFMAISFVDLSRTKIG